MNFLQLILIKIITETIVGYQISNDELYLHKVSNDSENVHDFCDNRYAIIAGVSFGSAKIFGNDLFTISLRKDPLELLVICKKKANKIQQTFVFKEFRVTCANYHGRNLNYYNRFRVHYETDGLFIENVDHLWYGKECLDYKVTKVHFTMHVIESEAWVIFGWRESPKNLDKIDVGFLFLSPPTLTSTIKDYLPYIYERINQNYFIDRTEFYPFNSSVVDEMKEGSGNEVCATSPAIDLSSNECYSRAKDTFHKKFTIFTFLSVSILCGFIIFMKFLTKKICPNGIRVMPEVR